MVLCVSNIYYIIIYISRVLNEFIHSSNFCILCCYLRSFAVQVQLHQSFMGTTVFAVIFSVVF